MGKRFAVYFLLTVFHYCVQIKCLNLQELNLHKELFKNYNSNVMPQDNKTEPIEVTLDLILMAIDEVDEKRQTISIKAFLEIQWQDAFLSWNSSKYPEISRISVKNSDIWIPDVALQDTFDKLTDLGQVDGKANVENNGLVTIWPYNIYTVSCKVSIGKFPFDKQSCQFDFQSWSHSRSDLVLKSKQKKPGLKVYKESGEWDLVSTKVVQESRPYGNESWDHVLFHFELKRKSLYHVMNVFVPVLCISVLSIISFLLPSESGERVTFSISIFLTLAVFLTTVNSSMPESSDEVASFSVYVGLQLFGSALTIIFTIISLNLYHHDKCVHVPQLLKMLVKACCVQKKEDLPVSTDIENENASKCLNDTAAQDTSMLGRKIGDVTWEMASKAIDKVCLYSAICWHVILTASLLISVVS
jgi:cation transporter family protein